MGIPRLTLTLICLALFVARYGYHRIGRLERNELVREECLVEKFVQRLRLNEVLVVDVTVTAWVDPNEAAFSLVFDKGVA